MNYGDVVTIEVKGQAVHALVARSVEIAPHSPADGQPVNGKDGKPLPAEEHVDLVYLDPEAKDQKGGPFVKVRELRHVKAAGIKDPGSTGIVEPASETKEPASETKEPASETKEPASETKEPETKGLGATVATVLAFLLLALAPLARAQQPTVPWVRAIDYATSNLASQQPNTYTWNLGAAPGPGSCVAVPANGQAPFFVFGPTASPYPQFIRDANPSDNEVVTPSATSLSGSSCGFTATPTYSHTTFWVSSGTAGLYEALGANLKSGGGWPLTVIVDAAFKKAVTALPGSKTFGALIEAIPAGLGSASLQIADTTTNPWTLYSWNGAAYFANGGGTPSIAAGAGLGTGPAGLTVTGNGAGGVISVTAGTSTATGTLFTLTFNSGTTSDGFNHSPTCTIESVGANTPSGTLAAGSVGGSESAGYTQPFTISTTALTASTFYSFSYSCH